MCGFFVVCDRRGDVDRARFSAALDSMDHRGPDDTRMEFETAEIASGKVSIGLGHKRLSIIDLDPRSGQPFSVDETTTVFNGEIYNFRDLKAQMTGHKFLTTGDTEVLCKQLASQREAAFANFIGQWAVVQLVRPENRLLLGRDFFGKKPLFYFHDTDVFIASSTVQAISRYLGRSFDFKQDFLESFLVSYGTFLAGDDSHIEGIEQIAPGHAASFSLHDWTLSVTSDIKPLPAESAADYVDDPERLFSLVEDAVLARLVSDREVGLFLSGGVDSTLILAILHKHGRINDVHCLIGETGLSDDAAYAKAITARLGVKAEVVDIDYASFGFEQFLKVCEMQERPFPLSGNLVAIAQLYSLVEKTDIKVVLDGTGADEIFGGYWDRYAPFALREAWRSQKYGWLAKFAASNVLEPRRARHAVRLAMQGQQMSGDPEIGAALGMTEKQFATASVAYDPLSEISDSLEQAQIDDIFKGRLQDWLWQNDRNSMAHSIEARSPFMDRRLYPYVHAPVNSKFRGAFNKYALRQTFDFLGGSETQWRRQKQGFRYQSDLFLASNRSKIIDMLSACSTIQKHFPNVSHDVLTSAKTPPLLLSKLLSISAADRALG